MWVLKTALALTAILAAVMLLVRWIEPAFAFFPSAGETTTPHDFDVEYQKVSIATVDDERLTAWSLGSVSPGPDVVYFHGNGGNLSVWAPILAGIARHGYPVLAFDYRGYGTSSGRPTEQGLYRDVEAVVAEVWRGARRDRPIIYWGRSIGAVMAAYAATVTPPDGLILESGFPDAWSLLRGSLPMALLALFSSYRFPAAAYMQRVTAPVLVMHGDADSVIPFAQGRALFEKTPGPKTFHVIRGGDHNDATPREPQAYWEAVRQFAAGLPKRTPLPAK